MSLKQHGFKIRGETQWKVKYLPGEGGVGIVQITSTK